MALKDIEPYQFTSDKQPDPAKKRVPKYKTRLKKFIYENIDIIDEKLKDGNYHFWQLAFERGFGKEKDNIELNINEYSAETKKAIEKILNDKRSAD